MTEKEYILKGLKMIEEVKPSDAGRWLSFKIKFLPRLISFINGEKFEEKVDIVEEAEKIFETR
jgi:hypothetical protein